MAGNINHESTILVTAKLNEERSIQEINKQIDKLGSKLDKVKVDISVNDISKTSVSKVAQQAQKNIQNTFNGMRLDLGHISLRDIFNIRELDIARDKVTEIATNIGRNLGKVNNVSFSGLKNGFVDFENGTKAVVSYVNNLDNGLSRNTEVIYRFDQENEQFTANVNRMSESYAKMDSVLEKQQARLKKLQQDYQDTSFKVDEFNQKVDYMPVPNKDTAKTDSAFNQMAEEQHKLNELRTSFSTNLPEQEQINILSQLQAQIKICNLEYQSYIAEVKNADNELKKQAKEKKYQEEAYYEEVKRTNAAIQKQEERIKSLLNTEKSTKSGFHNLNVKMGNMPTTSIESGTISTSYNALVSSYEKVLNLQRQYDTSLNGQGAPLSLEQQEELLSRISQEIALCNSLYKEYEAEVKNANKSVKDSAQQQSILNSKIEKAQAEIGLLAKTWTKVRNNKELRKELSRLVVKSKELRGVADLSEFNAQLSTFKTKCREAGVATSTWIGGVKEAWKHFSYFFSASRLFYLATQGIKQVYSNIKEVDSAMVELKKVANETDIVYSRFLKNAKKDSQELGSELSDFINATADFARLGYSVNDSEDLAKVATMYKNVGDDLSGIDEASSTIVSTMKAFNMNASQAESIVDKLNEVSNNFAVSSGDLGDGLANSASALAVAGNDINQTIALLTAGTEITQDASEMGNSIKVLSLRLRGMKGELEALGEETDDNVESLSKMQTQILNLTNGKVDIFDSNENFKSTYEIMKGISEVYDSLKPKQQASLLETIAGKQRANQVAALLTNFKQAERALSSSENSANSASKEQERWLDSIEGKLNTLQSAWESLSSDFMNSSSIKSAIDLLTSLANTLDDLISKVGLLPIAVSTLGIGYFIKNLSTVRSNISSISDAISELSTLSSIKNDNGVMPLGAMKESLEGLSEAQKKVVLNAVNIPKSVQSQLLSVEKLTKSAQKLSLENANLLFDFNKISESDFKNMTLFSQGNLVLEGVTDGTHNLTLENLKLLNSNKMLSDSSYETVKSFIEQKQASVALGKQTSTLKGIFTSVSTWIAIASIAISAGISAWNAYQEAQRKAYESVIEQSDESAESINKVMQAWDLYASLDSEATEQEKETAIKNVNDQLKDKIQLLGDATNAEKDYAESVLTSAKADLQVAYDKSNVSRAETEDKIKNKWKTDFQKKAVDDKLLTDPLGGSSEEAYKITSDILGEYVGKGSYSTTQNGIGNRAFTFGVNIDTSNMGTMLDYYDKVQKAISAIEAKANELGKDGDELLSSDYYKSLKAIFADTDDVDDNYDLINNYIKAEAQAAIYEQELTQGLPSTVENFNELKEACLGATDSESVQAEITSQLSSMFPELSSKVQETTSKLEDWQYAISDKNLSEKVDSLKETVTNIASTYKSLVGVVSDYNSNGYLTLDNLKAIIEAGNDYVGTLFNENGQLQINKESYIALAKAQLENLKYTQLQSAISNINALSVQTQASSNDTLTESTDNLTEATLKLAVAHKLDEGVSKSAIEEVLVQYSQYIALIDQAEKSLDSNADAFFGYTEEANNALTTQKEVLENQKDALEKQKDSLENAKDDISDLVDLVTDLIKKENELIKEEYEKQKESIDDLIDKRKELLETEKDEYEWNKKISESQNTVAKDALSLAVSSLDDSSAGKKNAKEASDTLSSSRSDMLDALTDRGYDIRINALDKMKEQQDEYWDNLIDSVDDYLNDEVRLYRDACSRIDNDSGELYGQLYNYISTYTTKSKSEFDYLWNNAQTALSDYNTANIGTLALLDIMQGNIYNVSGKIDDVSSAIDSVSDSINDTTTSITNNGQAIDDYREKVEKLLEVLPETNPESNDNNKKSGNKSGNGNKSESEYVNTPFGKVPTLSSWIANPSKYITAAYLPLPSGKYANGTKSAKGGLTVVDEEGINTELIPYQLSKGRYTILPEGNPVFSKTMTNTLYDIASNPTAFINQKNTLPHLNNTSMTSSINVVIQGDATQSTVNALKAQASKISDMAVNKIMTTIVNNKYNI